MAVPTARNLSRPADNLQGNFRFRRKFLVPKRKFKKFTMANCFHGFYAFTKIKVRTPLVRNKHKFNEFTLKQT